MSELIYRIIPLEKKSIVSRYEMYRENSDGSISWFNVEETFRWGQGFFESKEELPTKDQKEVTCNPIFGWGAELEDSCGVIFEFSDDISPEEQEQIREAYYENGISWLFDEDHDWLEEISEIKVYAPFQVDLCDEETGKVIEKNVELLP